MRKVEITLNLTEEEWEEIFDIHMKGLGYERHNIKSRKLADAREFIASATSIDTLE